MAEGRSTDSDTDSAHEVVAEQAGVQLAYRPKPADTLAGLRVRERIKRTGLLLRGTFLTLWIGQWLLSTVSHGIDPVSTVLFLFVTLVMWGYLRLQAAHVQRIVGWHGEYRVTVSPAGVTCTTDYSTLIQKWSVFRGYRETAGHFVLLSRDPNILCLDVLPKRGASGTGDLDRLRVALEQHLTRI